MASGAAFYVNMAGFNKQAITPDFPAKHIRYILNRNKAREVGSQHAPHDFHRAQDWLTAHYSAGRKNARVWTRFIVSMPHDLTHGQRVSLLRDYLAAMSRGRAQFVWAIHDDTASPHAHVVFVDKDVDTGRRVAQLSEASSAARWRKVWEDCCNRALAIAGSLARVSRMGKHSQHHRSLNERARAEKNRAVVAVDAPIAVEYPQLPPAPVLATGLQQRTPPSATEPIGIAMESVVKREVDRPTIATVVAFVASQMSELERLRATRQTISDYRASYAQVTASLIRTQARMDAIQPELLRAGTRVVKAEQEADRHKGIWSRLWQMISPAARSRAKAAKTAAEMAVYTLSTTQIKANNLLREAQTLQADQKALHEKANALKASLAVYGSDEDVDQAEKTLIRTIAVNSAELSAAELSQAMMSGDITADEHRRMMRAIDQGGLEA